MTPSRIRFVKFEEQIPSRGAAGKPNKATHTHSAVLSLSKPLVANCSVCLVAKILLPLTRKRGLHPTEQCGIESAVWCLDDKYLAIGKKNVFVLALYQHMQAISVGKTRFQYLTNATENREAIFCCSLRNEMSLMNFLCNSSL